MKAEQLSVFLENRAGRLAEVTHTLAEAGVNIRMISQGSSEIDIIVGVSEPDFDKAVRALYDTFAQ